SIPYLHLLPLHAALPTFTLTHRLRLSPKIGQAERAEMKLKAFGEGADSRVVTGYPGPGGYARHNSADLPGIDPYGTPVMGTVAYVLRLRGQALTPPSRLMLGRDDEAGNELDTDGALAGHGLDTEAPATEPSDEEDDE